MLKKLLIAICLVTATTTFSKDTDVEAEHAAEETYTINFNNVPITEYLRFISKIANVNFVFEDTDLQFNVTIVSEEPISIKNILSALVQILRIHDLNLLLQDDNYLITKSKDVHQYPPIISEDNPENHPGKAALVTRVFRIKNASVGSVAAIIRPMTSQDAVIDVSIETRQLIVTDIATNIEKIAEILQSIDSPHSPLDIDTFTAKSTPPEHLIPLATQILTPFSEGNPLIFVPQLGSNTIYIVSTPFLIEKAISILTDLDTGITGIAATGDLFVYKILYRTPDYLLSALKEIAKGLPEGASAHMQLSETLSNAKWVKDTNSLIFLGTTPSIAKIKEILSTIDLPYTEAEKLELGVPGKDNIVYIYKLKSASGEAVLKSLQKVAKNLRDSGAPNPVLIHTIEAITWIKESNSLLITGPEPAVTEVKELIEHFDLAGKGSSEKTAYYIYKPTVRSPEYIQEALEAMADDLKASELIDPDLIDTLTSSRYTEATRSLLFTGTPDSLDKLKEILVRVDSTADLSGIEQIGAQTFFIYKLKYINQQQLITAFETFLGALKKGGAQDPDLESAVKSMKWIAETNSVLFTGKERALKQIETLVEKFDIASLALSGREGSPSTYILYTPKYVSGQELISILCDFIAHLKSTGVADPGLYDTVDNLKWVERTCTLLVSGDDTSVKKVEALLSKFDVPSKESNEPSIQSIEETSFLVYKLQYHKGIDIQTALRQIAVDLAKGSSVGTGTNQSLLDAINSVQWIQVTNSLLASGQTEILSKLRELIQNIDVPLRQVFIEVLILETSLTNLQNFGLQWGGKMQYFTKFLGGGGNFGSSDPIVNTTAPTTLSTPLSGVTATNTPNNLATSFPPFTPGFDLGVIGDIIMHKGKSFISLGSLVNALQSDIDSTIVMNPKIITHDNNTSTLFIGQNIPFVGSVVTSQTGGTANVTSATSLEYRNVGTNITLTPILGNGDIITLDITTDLSNTTTNVNGNNGGINGIQTTQATMNTRVHVPDRYFVVLSGMIQDSKTTFRTSIPCLGGLPVIGAAFANNERQDTRDNIVIFIRPHIITSFEEYKKVTEHQEDVYKEQAVKPVLKEQFDAGVDIVKTPENE